MFLNKFTIQKSFAINAGAGSGKTYTLSRRYINALLGFDFFREKGFEDTFYDDLKPATTKQIVTITYTEAAALEMKERIFGLISKIINFSTLDSEDGDKSSIKIALEVLNDEQKDHVNTTLQKALKESSDAKISTIHSYCLDILKTNADIAKFDASIDIVKDDEKDLILNQSKFEVLNDKTNNETIKELSKYLNLFFLDTIFNKYATSSTFREQFDSFNKESFDEQNLKLLLLDLYKLTDVSDDFNIVCDRFDNENLEPKYKEFLRTYIDNFQNFQATSWSELSKEFDVKIQFNLKPFTKMKDIKENIENIKSYEEFLSIYSFIDNDKEILFYRKITLLQSLMKLIKAKYDSKLKELGKLDFDEIISKTHEIIQKVKLDIKYMMVDEFQDTNSTQYEIVKHSLNGANLFVVGDSKQSIYSFQGAEIEVFNDAINDKNYIKSIEPMDVNFRSDGAVLSNVNTIFETILAPNEDIKLIKQNYEATPQALKVSKEEKESQGSFSFLIYPQEPKSDEEESEAPKEDTDEYTQIAQFIANIKYGKLPQYSHITELIEQKEKAIAVVFDASTNMLKLKEYLTNHNIECKVSASENFYHTKEINDIFNLLMALQFPKDRFYKASALRSNILRYDDNTIHDIIKNNKEVTELKELQKLYQEKLLSEFILYVYQNYSFKEFQEYLSDSDQRKANLDKFLSLALEYEKINGSNNYNFLKQCEKNIYHSEAKEDEAFFKSDNVESIQLCTIHSTKGLAYPMVIVANSNKNIYTQIQSDSIKSNSFTLANGDRKLVTGFKVDKYEPLAFRLLKQIDKLKHLAEKKRLLYVALTRAEHDVVISGVIKKKKDGTYSLSESSYLGMISDGLELDVEELFAHSYPNSITNLENITIEKEVKTPLNETITLKPLIFETQDKPISATQSKDESNPHNTDTNAATLGTITHKIFELYWDRLDTIDTKMILDKFDITDTQEAIKITNSIDNFKQSSLYTLLKCGVKHRFELEFNHQDKRGFIDLVYFDTEQNGWVIIDFKTGKPTKEKEEKYQEQLSFYETVLSDIGYKVVDKKILWV